MDTAGKDKLIEDLRVVAADVEELLRATANQTGERVAEARQRAEDSLRTARARLEEFGDDVKARVGDGARATDRYVHDNPWQAVAVGAGLAFLLGYLFGRR
ncbi:MAG: DUF883 domain-containing protein [Burkholderiales bacterium]|nr:DUF883 domain-containing protein [Burkholderiales bacterium]